jgi:hypothetical protein
MRNKYFFLSFIYLFDSLSYLSILFWICQSFVTLLINQYKLMNMTDKINKIKCCRKVNSLRILYNPDRYSCDKCMCYLIITKLGISAPRGPAHWAVTRLAELQDTLVTAQWAGSQGTNIPIQTTNIMLDFFLHILPYSILYFKIFP